MTDYLTDADALQEQSDEDVLMASLSHPSLFALLVRKYEEPFLRKARSIMKSPEDAQDIVQETFTKIYLNAKRFKKQEGASFSSWAYRILINTALTQYVRAKKRAGVQIDLEPEILELIPDKNLRQFEKGELRDEVASVLSRMPAPLASALSAFFLEEQTQEEIARAQGVSVGAIKTRVHRAKREFKKVYETITTTV